MLTLSVNPHLRRLYSGIHSCLMRLKVLPPHLYSAKLLSDVKCSGGVGIFTFLLGGDYVHGDAREQTLALVLDTLSGTIMCQEKDVDDLLGLMRQVDDLKRAGKNRQRTLGRGTV